MNETLKRELNKTYLILSSGGTAYKESYEIEMIVKNAPQTMLPLHVLRIDEEIQLFFDVSSKQTLKDCAGRAKLSAVTIRTLFETIDELMREIKDYLLDLDCVVLDLEHIYTKEGKFYFCYCPWEKNETLTAFRRMLEEILGNLDYHDTEGVELAYHLYQSACRGNFDLSEILEEHRKEEKKSSENTDVYEGYFPQEKEELSDAFQNSFVNTQEKEEANKPGLLRRILQFFLKKEAEPVPEKETAYEREPYETYFYESNQEMSYTEVLEPADSGTVLLENMPVGRWKLRPLVPGYEEFCITGESFLVGKKRDSVDGYIDRDTISRIHSRLFIRQERLFIADANSTNGTFVNGVAIDPGDDVEIFVGDRILFADVGYECYNSL